LEKCAYLHFSKLQKRTDAVQFTAAEMNNKGNKIQKIVIAIFTQITEAQFLFFYK